MITSRPAPMSRAARVARSYVRVIEFVGAFGIAAVAIVAFMQVVFRYVVGASLFWSEEFMRYAMIWIVFVVAGLAYNRGEMASVELAIGMLPERWRRAAKVLGRLGIIAFLLVLAAYGADLAMRSSVSAPAGLGIPMVYLIAAIPVGSVLMILHVVAGAYLVPEAAVPETPPGL